MRKIKFLAILTAIILAFSQSVGHAQIFGVQVDPKLQFQTLTTQHFRIHFQQGMEDVVYEVAEIAEESYQVILDEFGQAPDVLDIVLLDAFDFSNGSANPIYDVVTLVPNQYGLSNWSNIRLDSWWRMVIFHELVHAIELDMTQGINKTLRALFGKLSLPNLVKPVPFIEGLAVYEKYKHLGESRLNDSRTQMITRQMVLDNSIPEFDQIKQFYSRSEWPGNGFLVYNFGSWLMRYIEETYGKDALKRFDQANSGNLMNLFFFSDLNETIEKAFGVSADEIYGGFRHWLRDQFDDEIERIQQQKLTEPVQVTALGYNTQQPAWSPDGKWIAYTHTDLTRSDLRLITPAGEEDQEIATGASISQPGWSADGKSLVYTKLDYDSPHYIHGDIYRYDTDNKREKRLTTGARAYFAQFGPGGSIYYAHNSAHDGSTALSQLDSATGEIRLIKDFPGADGVIHSFALSPDGNQFAIALLKRGGFQDIYLMPANGGNLTPVTQNKDQDMSPAWSANGEYLLFTADPNRVYNLYAYQLSTGLLFQITNMMSGAFTPTLSPDGSQLAFVSYDSQGYDISKMPFEPTQWTAVTLSNESISIWPGYPPHTTAYQPYNSFAYLLPKAWMPMPTETGFGIFAMGADPLFRHIYSGFVGWDFQANQPTFSLTFQHNASFPINVILSQTPDEYLRSVIATIPLALSVYGQQSLMLGYERSKTVPDAQEDNGGELFSLVQDRESDESAASIEKEAVKLGYHFTKINQDDLFSETINITTDLELWKPIGANQWLKELTLHWSEGFTLAAFGSGQLLTRVGAGWTDATLPEDKFELGGHAERFTLRGFEAKTFLGNQVVTASAQSNFKIATIERSVGHWPVFFDDLWVGFFVDAGMASGQLNLKELHIGFGAELSLTTSISYFIPLTITAGVGQGLGTDHPVFYFNFGVLSAL